QTRPSLQTASSLQLRSQWPAGAKSGTTRFSSSSSPSVSTPHNSISLTHTHTHTQTHTHTTRTHTHTHTTTHTHTRSFSTDGTAFPAKAGFRQGAPFNARTTLRAGNL